MRLAKHIMVTELEADNIVADRYGIGVRRWFFLVSSFKKEVMVHM